MPAALRNKEINILKLDQKLYFWTRLEIETMIIRMWIMCMGSLAVKSYMHHIRPLYAERVS